MPLIPLFVQPTVCNSNEPVWANGVWANNVWANGVWCGMTSTFRIKPSIISMTRENTEIFMRKENTELNQRNENTEIDL